MKKKIMGLLLAILMVIGLIPDVSLTAYAEDPYASIKNTTTVVHFDGKDWYLIDYDNTTVTLLTKDSVGTSTFGSNNKYDESTVKTFVNDWYSENISAAKKEAVSGGGMFLLNAQQVNKIPENVRKCNTSKGSWWTSSGGTNNTVMIVNGNNGDFDDEVDEYGCWNTCDVRPALKLNLEKVDFIAESKRFKLKGEGHYVAITPGNNMTKTSDSGNETQNNISGKIKDVVYNANEGYYFPEDYSIAEVNGVNVTRDSYTKITVSGIPTNDALITLTDPTAKTTPAAPTTAVSKNCTNLDNNNGELIGVTTEMEYRKSDDTDWAPGTGNDITGLEPGTYYVRYKETDTTLPSENQELTIKKFVEYTVMFEVVNGSWNDETDTAKTVTVEGYEGEEIRLRTTDIPAVGSKPNTGYKAGSWNTEPTNTTTITQDTTYTYTYASKGEQTISVENVNVTYGDTDKKVEASVSDPTTGGGEINYSVKEGSKDYIDVDASNGSLTIKKVPSDGKAYVIVTATENDDYLGTTKEVTITIAKKEVTVSGITAEDKVYDGNTDAALKYDNVQFNGTLDSDNLSVNATGTFEDEKAGTDKKVTISDLALAGDSASNYKLAAEGQQTETKANIIAKYKLTVHFSSIDGDDLLDPIEIEAIEGQSYIIAIQDWVTENYEARQTYNVFMHEDYRQSSYWQLKSINDYADWNSLHDDYVKHIDDIVEKDMDVYISMLRKVNDLDVTIDAPICGTETKTDGDDYWENQTNPPKMKINSEHVIPYIVKNEHAAVWVTDDGFNKPFIGTFEGEEEYNINSYIKTEYGYAFADPNDLTFTFNGKELEEDQEYVWWDLSSIEIRSKVKAEHDWTEWKVVKGATITEEGLEERICNHCGEKETRPIPKAEKDVYSNIAGNNQTWTKGSSNNASFTFKRNKQDELTFENFDKALVDGKEITKDKDYTYKSGSVIIYLQSSFLDTLPVGEHTLTAMFKDGNSVDVKFNITEKKKESTTPTYIIPKTGVE